VKEIIMTTSARHPALAAAVTHKLPIGNVKFWRGYQVQKENCHDCEYMEVDDCTVAVRHLHPGCDSGDIWLMTLD
jgi:hypothetical protein